MTSAALDPRRATFSLRDGRSVIARQVRSADAARIQSFVCALSPVARRMRFFAAIRELAPDQIERMTSGVDLRDATFAAFTSGRSEPRIVALAECAARDETAEFGIVVADDCARQGLGRRMLELLVSHAAEAGLDALEGAVLPENEAMLALAAALGFHFLDDDDFIRVRRSLQPTGALAAVLRAMERTIRPMAMAWP